MKNIIHFYFLLNIIALFLIELVYAKNGNEKINFAYKKYKKTKNKELSKKDKFYMIFVNNTSPYQKRENEVMTLNSLIDDIQDLIIDNKDTYKDPSVLEELEENGQLRKRNSGESNLVYLISSVESKSVLYAYLSPYVVNSVRELPNIIACEPNHGLQFFSYYNTRDIQLEANWKNFTIRDESDLHLSLISQGKFSDDLVNKYDTNFYYPESAGKDIDIFIIDSGFNFDYREFSNVDERIVKCGYNITNGKVYNMASTTNCHVPTIQDDHGTEVADVAAGNIHGVANKANVYGFLLNEQDMLHEADILAGLQYIKKNLFRPYKAVINLSLGGFYSLSEKYETLDYLQELITEMSNAGAVFVVAAGNEAVEAYSERYNEACYPCSFKDVICVGAIDTVGINNIEYPTWDMINTNIMKTANYVKADFSNYGQVVDIYGPGYAKVEYKTFKNKLMGGIDGGTSFSTPIIAGVAATIMSEHPKMKFTTESMLTYLTKLAEKDMIGDLTQKDHNLFINNGKHIVYSSNNIYDGCGVRSGNKMCEDACCSIDGHCTREMKSCRTDQGCQIKYGLFMTIMSPEFGRCGFGYGICPYGTCCSYDGYCGKSENYCGIGCQVDYGFCKKEYIFE
ncbi:subtilisin-like protein [Piromyces finnis]|uniref:Subtilisin-like protein n=1 Tax=Piromyces finnis TaxID=1754191 RepID=A0A1Y1VCP9_9FUNG|nr:subtilisin-like protein [Piromyces finnis]|eukprot:ORX52637.1 subtilisin-like protein [Piromyces finnis]